MSKNIKFIRNPYYPANFKEWDDVLEHCVLKIEELLHTRKKLNNELKQVRELKKHLLKNPIKRPNEDKEE